MFVSSKTVLANDCLSSDKMAQEEGEMFSHRVSGLLVDHRFAEL